VAKLAVETYFELEGLVIHPDALGTSGTVRAGDDLVVRIDLPGSADAFKFGRVGPVLSDGAADPRDYEPTSALLKHSDTTYEARIVRVVANLNAPFGASDHADWAEPEALALADSTRNRLLEACVTALTNFTEWVWVHKGQVWNSPSGEYPRLVSTVQLIDVDGRVAFGPLVGRAGDIRILPGESFLTRDDVTEIAALTETSGGPDLGELLLAEARHFLWRTERLAPDRAVVLAAMASELSVKRLLREGTAGSVGEMVTLLLENPRDWSMAAIALWDKAMAAAFGHSLRTERPDLYKSLDRLFQRRNRIVHRGEATDVQAAWTLVGAAVDAALWLDAVRASPSKPAPETA
jgi:hypothetical protein